MFSTYFSHKSLLHTILRLNSAFSGFFSLVFLLFPAKAASWLGIPSTSAVLIAGILLLGWGIFVSQLVRRSQISSTRVWVVILGDLAWVFGSMALLLGSWLPLTKAGIWFIAFVADIVLVFAVVQYLGLKHKNNQG